MKAGDDLRQQLSQIEAFGNDDFQLILLGGVEAFATHELHFMLRRLRLESIHHRKYKRQLFILGAILPFLLGMATLFVAVNQLGLVYFTLGFLVFCIIGLAYGNQQVTKLFSNIPYAKRLRHIIQLDLERRRLDAEIY